MKSNHPTQLDESIRQALETLVTNAHNFSLRGNSSDFVVREVDEAHRRLKLLVLRERQAEAREVPIQLHAEHASHKEHCIPIRYRNARIKTLEQEMEELDNAN